METGGEFVGKDQGLWVSGEAFERVGQDTHWGALGDWIITEWSVSKETIF